MQYPCELETRATIPLSPGTLLFRKLATTYYSTQHQQAQPQPKTARRDDGDDHRGDGYETPWPGRGPIRHWPVGVASVPGKGWHHHTHLHGLPALPSPGTSATDCVRPAEMVLSEEKAVRGQGPMPRVAFLADLQEELQSRKFTGKHLIVMMDANGDVTADPIHQIATTLGLWDTILLHNPPSFPATHRNGSCPIDIIMASLEISVLNAAFLAGQDSLGDHCTAIVDFCDTSVLGKNMLKIVRPQARCLVCRLPEVHKRYIDLLNSYLRQHQVLEKLHFVQEHRFTNTELTPELSHVMTTIDHVREECMKAVEKCCCKLCMGNVDFSPMMVALG
jgi:hypothetical protein